LIGGANGRPIRVDVKRKSTCYRCDDEIPGGGSCISIPSLGSGFSNKRRVCDACYQAILKQTAADLEVLRHL
jgi:hypothetical protein